LSVFFFFFFFALAASGLVSVVDAAGNVSSRSLFIAALSLFRFFFFALKISTSLSTFKTTVSSSTLLALLRFFFLCFFTDSASAHYSAVKHLKLKNILQNENDL